MLRTIGIISGKGGVGKTVSTINLGAAMHELGEDVVLIDTDITTSNLGIQLGMYSFPATLEDVIEGKDIMQSIHIHSSGLRMLPSSLAYNYISFDHRKLKKQLNNLNGYILIDSPPGLNKDSIEVLRLCDEFIVITNPETPAVTDAVKVLQTIRSLSPEKQILGVVVNKANKKNYELKPSEIEMICEAPVLDIVPDDENVKKAINEKEPVVKHRPYAPSSLKFKKIAAHITGKRYEKPTMPKIKHYISALKN